MPEKMSFKSYIRALKKRRKKKKGLMSGVRSTDASDYYEAEGNGGDDGGTRFNPGGAGNPGGSPGGGTGG